MGGIAIGTDNANDGVPNNSNKALEEVQSHPPAQLLEDDPEVSSSQKENIKNLAYLDVKRQKVEEQLGSTTAPVKIINRHNCVKDMLVLFKEHGIVNCNLCFVFEGSGQGVIREVYSRIIFFTVAVREPLISRFLYLQRSVTR